MKVEAYPVGHCKIVSWDLSRGQPDDGHRDNSHERRGRKKALTQRVTVEGLCERHEHHQRWDGDQEPDGKDSEERPREENRSTETQRPYGEPAAFPYGADRPAERSHREGDRHKADASIDAPSSSPLIRTRYRTSIETTSVAARTGRSLGLLLT